MRRTSLIAGTFLIIGAVAGFVVGNLLRTPSSTDVPQRSPSALRQLGEPSFDGVTIRYNSTQGVQFDVQYSAPPASEQRQLRPLVTLTNADEIQINDGVHDVVIDTAEGTIDLNDKEVALVRVDKDCRIYISGDGQMRFSPGSVIPKPKGDRKQE